ncbi:PREDICTED: la-related protein 6-like [Chaetura pelagica]|uniref:la-related protein 6-like n=1 Tax=Chaetura pelagica TaxID=8897 RepID=UPI000523ECB5|nr:PREDICTED: la-related protein 6-like [Chaetura pelagica]
MSQKATNSHLCPCCSDRGCSDGSNALGAELLGCNYSIPDPQLVWRIVAQVEFYLSDENLAKDAFLLKHVQKNKMGFVSIKLLTSFKKVKYLTRDWRLTLYALRFSALLEVNEEGTKVRRRVPVPEALLKVPPSKGCSDGSNALGAELLGCNYSIPDPQLVWRIVAQVEFYLSDENLAKDAFLLKHVQKNKMGFVSIKLLTSFKKVKYLTRDWRLTLYALRFSALLEVNEEGTKVRRRVPVPSVPPSNLLLAWELLPQKNFLETVTRMFSPFGAISSIRILRPGRNLPSDVRRYTVRFPELLSKCCALVEYESLESARRAFEDLGHQGHPARGNIRVGLPQNFPSS